MPQSMHEDDERILLALTAGGETREELKPLVSLYEAVFRAQFLAKAGLAQDLRLPSTSLCRERLDRGLIMLTFDQLQLDTDRFRGLLRQITEIIVQHNPGWELPREPLAQEALVGIARRWFESGEHMVGNGPPAALVALVVGFTVSTYLQEAARRLLPEVDLSIWQRNTCPVCGGKPGFGILSRENGSRCLFCPRCHATWPYRRVTCPFCEHDESTAYYPSTDEVHRLYVCRNCRRYLKAIDLRHTQRDVILPVERILTVALDLAAQEEGYLYC
jgi:FdhE protein